MHSFVASQSSFRVLHFKDSEVIIFSVELFKFGAVDLVLKLGNAKILDFDRVCNSPFETNRNRRQVIGVLQKLQLGTSLKSFSFKLDSKRLSVADLEENAQMMLAHILWVVQNT